MPIQPIVGPAGAGKSQVIEAERKPGDVVIDFSMLHAAITGAVRGPDGKFPVRANDDPALPLVSAVQAFALSEAVRRELSGFVTTASREHVARLERVTGVKARVVDPGPLQVLARLTEVDDGGNPYLDGQCVAAARRWWTKAENVVWHTRGIGSWKAPDGKTHAVRSRPSRGRRRR